MRSFGVQYFNKKCVCVHESKVSRALEKGEVRNHHFSPKADDDTIRFYSVINFSKQI